MGVGSVGIGLDSVERAPERERRLARDGPLADADRRQDARGGEQRARRRGDGAVEAVQSRRPDRGAREDRDGLVVGGRAPAWDPGERVATAPRAMPAQRLQAQVVGLGAERVPAAGDLRRLQERVERALVLPHREQRPPAQVGRQRHRLTAAGAQQPPEAQAGLPAQQRAVQPHPRQALRRVRARVADEVKRGEGRH
jgi:hypothetical protein